jgi:hypothetical protein
MRSVLVLLTLSGCGIAPIEEWQLITYIDDGELCFQSQGPDLLIAVTAPDCLSSSCSEQLGGGCEPVVDNLTITLTSEVYWQQYVGVLDCTDDCGAPTVSCKIAGLPEGTYTVLHGDDQVQLVVPVAASCPGI